MHENSKMTPIITCILVTHVAGIVAHVPIMLCITELLLTYSAFFGN